MDALVFFSFSYLELITDDNLHIESSLPVGRSAWDTQQPFACNTVIIGKLMGIHDSSSRVADRTRDWLGYSWLVDPPYPGSPELNGILDLGGGFTRTYVLTCQPEGI